MIRIGLNIDEKQLTINNYLQKYKIRKVFVFNPTKFSLPTKLDVPVEYIKYDDIIMYKFFYRLLEEIDNNTLLVFNECLRTQKRSDLTYNCAHHYCDQTNHKIVFEYLPFIETNADFMILLDFINKGKYKSKSFDYHFLQDEDIKAKPVKFILEAVDMLITANDVKKYENKKEQLFDNLGNSDPDIIPRQLHVWAGNLKKYMIDLKIKYVARNDRFKLPNVTAYKNIISCDYDIIDFPHRRIDFNDFLKITSIKNIKFINSGLKVDLYYINELNAWIKRLGEFYAKTSIYS
jgi:hypothetical protein